MENSMTRLDALPESQTAGRDQTEMAALMAVTGLPVEKANDYYAQTLKARGADPSDTDFNMGNTWVSSLDKKLWGVRVSGDTPPIQVFDRTRDPEAFSKMKKATGIERSDSGRSFAKWPDVVYIAKPENMEEELSHQLNFAFSKGSVAYGKTGDRAMADALEGAKKAGLGDAEAYYVFGKRNERVNAMAMAKHAVMRAKEEPVPLLTKQGEGAVGEFIGEVKRGMQTDNGHPDDLVPVRAVIRAYDKLSKTKPDEMTPEQREAWKDLSDASVWDQLAKTEKNRGPSADKEVMADTGGGTSRRDADVAREAEKIRGTLVRVEGDRGSVEGPVARIAADLAPAAQRGRIENAIRVDAANRARRAEYDRLAAENRKLVGKAGLARYDELTAKGRPDARSQTSDALAYALRDNPVLAPESRPDVPPARPTHDKNGHPLTYTQDSKWVPDAAPRATRRESSADREFREATHVPTGVTIIGDQKFTTYADGTIGDTTAEHMREARESKALSEALLRQDAKGGDAGGEVTENAEIVSSGEVADTPVTNGPRIVVNPAVFKDKRDALCVAYNEAFRVVMEEMEFDPMAEPTDEQREFFADTAYADDENMMRRTIVARICTFDTSVRNPTNEQIEESVEFLHSVLKAGFPQNEHEQSIVQRAIDVLGQTLSASTAMPEEPAPEEPAPEEPAPEEPAPEEPAPEEPAPEEPAPEEPAPEEPAP